MIKVWKTTDWPNDPYPWRFSVVFEGKEWTFAGIPNQCETKRSATARAAWRLKWMREGTFDKHYG